MLSFIESFDKIRSDYRQNDTKQKADFKHKSDLM